jgi:hypothetical protein
MDPETPRPAAAISHEIGEQRVCRCKERGESNEGRRPVQTTAARHAALAQTAGALTGVYVPGYLASVREDCAA